MKEEISERGAYDMDAGIFPDVETVELLTGWVDSIVSACWQAASNGLCSVGYDPAAPGGDSSAMVVCRKFSAQEAFSAQYLVKYISKHHHSSLIPVAPIGFDLIEHLRRQRAFSLRTFGPGSRVEGIINHIRKELDEVLSSPCDINEWIDIVLLALDGAWRADYSPRQIAEALAIKQSINEVRTWPDWRSVPEGQPIEHLKQAIK